MYKTEIVRSTVTILFRGRSTSRFILTVQTNFSLPPNVFQAYGGALMKVEDEEGIRAFHSLIGSLLDELKLHASYATNWGIDINQVSLFITCKSQAIHLYPRRKQSRGDCLRSLQHFFNRCIYYSLTCSMTKMC